MIGLHFLLSCIEPPKELPPSRIKIASTGSMIRFGDLEGFLVTRGTPTKTVLWQVEEITSKLKKCALEQVPSDTKALLISSNLDLAKQYLKTDSPPTPFTCSL